jgi:hypothetical protein
MELGVVVISLGAMLFTLPVLLLPQSPSLLAIIVAVVAPQGRIICHAIDLASDEDGGGGSVAGPWGYVLANELFLAVLSVAYWAAWRILTL